MGLGAVAIKLSVGAVGLAVAARLLLVGVGPGWTADDIPEGTSKTVIVTGANAGLGLATAKALALKGYHVVMACRSQERGAAAAKSIAKIALKGSVEVEVLDLAEPASVKDFASRIASKYKKIDILINNAGVMMLPKDQRNSLGWERQIATNHFGHFILTALLLPLLKQAKGRIVNHASIASLPPYALNTTDLNWELRPYDPVMAYAATKRANVLFTHSLNQKLEGTGVTATVCHPGGTASELQEKATGLPEWFRSLLVVMRLGMMDTDHGALPQLRVNDFQSGRYDNGPRHIAYESHLQAAVDAKADQAVGPLWLTHGTPIILGNSLQVLSPFLASQQDADSLWRASETLTGVSFLA